MITLGIDAHKRSHTVVAVDELGRQLGVRTTTATTTAEHLDLVRSVGVALMLVPRPLRRRHPPFVGWTDDMSMDSQMTPALRQAAIDVVTANKYLVLATASLGGTPWVRPVYFAHDDLASFWWVSRPLTRHSRLISANPQVAITVFDSSVPIGRASAVYSEAWAAQCSDSDARREIGHYSGRSVRHGVEPWTVDDVTGAAEFRLYRARTARLWLLADDDGPDHRIAIAIPTAMPTLPATAPATRPATVGPDDRTTQ